MKSIYIIVEIEKVSVRQSGAIGGNLQQNYPDCAQFFFQNETRIDMSGAIGGNAQSTRLFHGRTRRQCAIDACFAGAIGSNSIKVPFLPKNFKENRLKKRLILQ